ncbi:hypothetical protein RUS48_00425 [Mycoplasmoides gallisepticum]|nr:hypothetical protein RUS48_00425 [Mycoplasmoides gallisepticum]
MYRKNNQLYVYLAKVAQHYQNISFNNQNLGVLLIEDSAVDRSEYLRKTAQYVADFEQVNDQNLVNELLDNLAKTQWKVEWLICLKSLLGLYYLKSS